MLSCFAQPRPVPCHRCGVEITTTWRPIPGKKFTCPACKPEWRREQAKALKLRTTKKGAA